MTIIIQLLPLMLHEENKIANIICMIGKVD
jgi:hypothetical protein